MQGRAFLNVAKRLLLRSSEEDWRTAAGRAYYALFGEARAALKSWGFVTAKRDPIHTFVRLRFTYSNDADLQAIGLTLEQAGQLRNKADYGLDTPGPFATSAATVNVIQLADHALARLDQIQSDANRRSTATVAVRATLPP